MASKSVRKQHEPEVINAALEEIKAKRMTIRQASSTFGVPTTTLYDKLSGRRPIVSSKNLLTKVEEEKLAKWLVTMAENGFGKTNDEVCETARAMITSRQPGLSEDVPRPTRQWLYLFFKRHPELTTRSPMSLGKERAIISSHNIEVWFRNLKESIDKIDPTIFSDPKRIYNADESGFAFDAKARKVVACKGAKHVYNVTANTKTQVTVLACTNAAGQYTPPLLIYPYKRIPRTNLLQDFPEAILQVSSNGWITAAIFFTWMKEIFIPFTKDLPKPILLLVDCHTSHTPLLETSILCSENQIILYCLLPHASHVIQPLDQAFYGAMKSAWADAIKEHRDISGEGINLESFAGVLKPVWKKVATQEIAASSFRAAGIYPLNAEKIINSSKLFPSRVYRPSPAAETTQSTYVASQKSPIIHQEIKIPPLKEITTSNLASVGIDQPESPIPLESSISVILPKTSLSTLPLGSTTPVTLSQSSTSTTPLEICTSVARPVSYTGTLDFSTSIGLPESSTFTPPPQSNSSCLIEPSSSGSSSQVASEISPLFNLNVQQIKALKEHVYFIYDETTKNDLTMFFSRITNPQNQISLDDDIKFKKFHDLTLSLIQAFQLGQIERQQSRAFITQDDILKIPSFKGKGKGKGKKSNPRITPTIPSMLSGEEFQNVLKRKIDEKDQEEKDKLVKQMKNEEKKRKAEEVKEQRRILKEQQQAEKKKRQDDLALKKMLAQQMKKLQSKKSQDSDNEEEVWGAAMEAELEAADEEEELANCTFNIEEKNDSCPGCNKKEGDSL
uniref:HTH CENPB-type domain-containing protein n=1 Tax=Biomphalaria glabrata TaxID=6526 RepID=A0A2C9LW81_BIOGL